MAVDIIIDIPQLKQLQAALLKAADSTSIELNTAIKKSAIFIQGQAAREAPVDTGRLRSSIGVQLLPLKAVVSPKVDYAIYIHQGTRPHFPPIRAIQTWAVRHGISPYALALAISRRGTKANPFMKRAAESSKESVRMFFGEALVAITKVIKE